MNLNNEFLKDGLVKAAIQHGNGMIRPIVFDWDRSKGVALMNPSIYNDNGQLRAVVRCVNYTLHHSEMNKFPHWGGPLQYIHPETDVRLATENFIIDLDDNLEITKVRYVDMQLNAEKPLWEFHGLEDARLFRWDGKLYMCGVRRDTTDNGQGRMELSEIELEDNVAVEVSRTRVPSTGNDDSYCEKNWMPIEGMEYKWVKWSNPTEIAHYSMNEHKTYSYMNEFNRFPISDEIRGGTHVIKVDEYYVGIGHSVRLWKPYSGEKDSDYTAHIMVWDENWNIVNITPRFRFMNAKIEFQCGLTHANNGDLIVSFAEMDNGCYCLQMDKDWFKSLMLEGSYGK